MKVSKGTLSAANFTLVASGSGEQLVALALDATFAKANITITAKDSGGADSFVQVGRIDASGIDLGNVTIAGDLGKILSGDTNRKTRGLGTLKLDSLGVAGLASQNNAGDLVSSIEGPMKDFNIHTGVYGAAFYVNQGNIGNVTVPNGMYGGLGVGSGGLFVSGRGGAIAIGDLYGASGDYSGSITISQGAKKVSVGAINGGGGVNSGKFFSQGNVPKVGVHGNITGGAGANSGEMNVGGSKKVLVAGDINGGTLDYAGALLVSNKAGKVNISGSVYGGGGTNSGTVDLFGGAKSLTIGGSVFGGGGTGAGGIVGGKVVQKISITGTIFSGSGTDSGGMYTSGSFGTISVGTIVGSSAHPVAISAQGQIGKATPAIARLTVTGDANFAKILAGYFGGAANNPDASIGTVSIGGNFTSSSIVAGIADMGNNGFGNMDDALIVPLNGTPSARILATIGKVIVAGTADGTAGGTDSFAIEAEFVKSVKLGGAAVALVKKAHNDNLAVPGSTTGDFVIREL